MPGWWQMSKIYTVTEAAEIIRARLAEIAKRARAAVYITADGRTKTVKRGKAGAR